MVIVILIKGIKIVFRKEIMKMKILFNGKWEMGNQRKFPIFRKTSNYESQNLIGNVTLFL